MVVGVGSFKLFELSLLFSKLNRLLELLLEAGLVKEDLSRVLLLLFPPPYDVVEVG